MHNEVRSDLRGDQDASVARKGWRQGSGTAGCRPSVARFRGAALARGGHCCANRCTNTARWRGSSEPTCELCLIANAMRQPMCSHAGVGHARRNAAASAHAPVRPLPAPTQQPSAPARGRRRCTRGDSTVVWEAAPPAVCQRAATGGRTCHTCHTCAPLVPCVAPRFVTIALHPTTLTPRTNRPECIAQA